MTGRILKLRLVKPYRTFRGETILSDGFDPINHYGLKVHSLGCD